MSSCKIIAPNGEPSILHGGLYRYYKEAGVKDDMASDYATADWVQSKTPSFSRTHNAVIIDPNNEPQLHYGENNKPLGQVSDQELHEGLANDKIPFYLKLVRGVKTAIDAVRAKPSALNYQKRQEAPDDIRLFARYLSERFNVEVNFITRNEAAALYRQAGKSYRGQSAFVVGGKSYAIQGQVSKGNLVHEVFGHPILELLEREHPHVYAALVNESMRNEELKKLVQQEYPDEVRSSGVFTEEGKKEVILKALELDAANKLDSVNGKGLKPFITRLWNAVKKIFGITDQALSSISTVGDLTRMVLGESTLNLGQYVPEKLYSTTSGAIPTDDPQALADEIIRAGTSDGRISFDRTTGLTEEYRDSKNPDKKILRSSNVALQDFAGEILDTDPYAKAVKRAEIIFSNAKKNTNNPDDRVQLEGSPKQYNFKELTYHYLRESNDARNYGNIGHLLMHIAFNNDPRLTDELNQLMATKYAPEDSSIVIQSGITDPYAKFHWLFADPDDPEDKGAIHELKEMIGYEVGDEEPVILTEHIIHDEQWNIAGRPDLTLVFAGRKDPKTGKVAPPELGTVDYKFGQIEKGLANEVMNHFDLKSVNAARISRLNIATMNMILRNVMLKKKIPWVKWKFMKIASMRNGATRVKLMDNYSMKLYLDAISHWESETHPESHAANVKAGLYEVDNYFGEPLEVYKMMGEWEANNELDVNELIKDPQKALIAIADKTTKIYAQIQAIGSDQKLATLKTQLSEQLSKLSVVRLQLESRTLNPSLITEKDDDLPHWLIWHNLNQYDVTINILSALKDLRNERMQAHNERKVRRDKIHQQYVDDLKKEKGISNLQVIGGMPYYKGDSKGFWDFLFVERPREDGEPGTNMAFISKNRDADKYNKLRKAEKAYADYFLKNVEEAYNKSVADRQVVDVFGKPLSKATALGLPTKWDPDNAMVFVPMMSEEESERNPGVVTSLKRLGKGLVNAFTVTDFDRHAREHAGLPVKYLSLPPNMRAEKGHSLNGEHILNMFMQHMDHLDLMEDVYSTAKGVETMMRYYEMDGKQYYKNGLDYLQHYIDDHILGKRNFESIMAGKARTKEGKVKGIDMLKMLEATRTLNTFATLSFQPVLAGLNFTLINTLNYKHAIEGLLSKKLLGVKDIDFGPAEMALGQKDYAQLQLDIYSGKQEDNKLYQMLKEWKWQPDNYDFVTRKKDMGYTKNKALDPAHLLFLHAITENMGNISILAAMLRAQKVKAGNKEISLYDAYTVNTETDADTGKKIKTLGWKAGVRGYVKIKFGAGERMVEVTKLTPEEIGNLKKLSARLTGDYRQDERGAAESHALWNMVKQFKRFMFRYFKNMADQGKLDATLGKYIDSGETPIDMEDGTKVPVLKWERVYSEGWARTAMNGLLCTLLLYNPIGLKRLAGHFIEDPNVFIEKYRWKNLSDFQKQNVMRASSNFLFVVMSLVAYGAFDDDDSFLVTRLRRMISDMAEGGNLTDTLRSWEKPAPALSKMKNVLQYSGEFFVSAITDDRTREGNLRGLKDLTRQFGPTAGIEQAVKVWEGK